MNGNKWNDSKPCSSPDSLVDIRFWPETDLSDVSRMLSAHPHSVRYTDNSLTIHNKFDWSPAVQINRIFPSIIWKPEKCQCHTFNYRICWRWTCSEEIVYKNIEFKWKISNANYFSDEFPTDIVQLVFVLLGICVHIKL